MTTLSSTTPRPSVPKRADQRSTITILLLGDEGVGKSSLISTFVSRYFSEVVPGIMTRVRLPPDPELSCVTTIVDSQGGDLALLQAMATRRSMMQHHSSVHGSTDSLAALMERAETSMMTQQSSAPEQTTTPTVKSSGIENVDSIVLVYDLDRVETFFRLENHWLPLIERCYNGKVPVIVAENKLDLFRPSSTAGMTDEQAVARQRQQIVSLLQRFPFVRQCIKCSAKNLVRVDDVFLKAQQAVLYPFTPPLYDLEHGRLTEECKRAFTRIFRMYDSDRDGLLSDVELNRFQIETYHVAVFDRDFSAWKKVVSRNNPTDEVVIQDGKFTIAGFFAIFDLFISQNRLDVVWQALREFNYDDDLNLHIPEIVTAPTDDTSWKLSSGAKIFLSGVFRQFDQDQDDVLTADDIGNIFSILHPPALPPWHPARAPFLFAGCFSLPKQKYSPGTESPNFGGNVSLILPGSTPMAQSLSNSGISILSASDSLPSVALSGISVSEPLTFLEWMGHWHTIAAISPSVTRAELFRLGHSEESRKTDPRPRRSRKKKSASITPSQAPSDATFPSSAIRVLVLGSGSCGKTALLNALCGSMESTEVSATNTTSTLHPETSSTYVKIGRGQSLGHHGTCSPSKSHDVVEEIVAHLVFTDVPETAAVSQKEHYRELSELFGSTASPKDRVCDLAMLVFDASSPSSFEFARELEAKLLTQETPRVFIATKSDKISAPEPEDGDAQAANVLDTATIHCRESDLELPLLTSAADGSLLNFEKRNATLDHLARCALVEAGVTRLKSRPHEEKQRRETNRRRKMMWLGGIVSVGVVVAAGVGLLWGSHATKKEQTSGFGWLRNWFGGTTRGNSPQAM
jgi:Ras family protein T1